MQFQESGTPIPRTNEKKTGAGPVESYQLPEDQLQLLMSADDAEFSAEEQIKALWNEQEKVCDYANGIREGIRQTLSIIGIKYDWLQERDAE